MKRIVTLLICLYINFHSDVSLAQHSSYGIGGWTHENVYDPLRRQFSDDVEYYGGLHERWNRKVPILGGLAGLLVGAPLTVTAAIGQTAVNLATLVTPQTQDEHVAVVAFNAFGESYMVAGRLAGYIIESRLWASLFRKSPSLAPKVIEDVMASAAQPYNVHLSKAARAIAKKLGSAESGKYTSAFHGIKVDNAEADKLIRAILNNPSRIVQTKKNIDVYNDLGQGIRFFANTNEFQGLLEALRASR